jgi:hypothetical protein
MAAIGMPYSLVFPPTKQNEGANSGGHKWRHPMERTTDLFFEAEMAMTMFHMPFHEWLQRVPKEARIFQMAVYRLHLEKENYWNTLPEKRFNYFNRE